MSAPRFAVRGRLAIDGRLEDGVVLVDHGTISEVHVGADAVLRAKLPDDVYDAPIVSPGLIDLQINGAFGVDLVLDDHALAVLSSRLPSTGVTAFLPTIVSSPASVYRDAAARLASFAGGSGAQPLGLHIEGPFLARSRAGAHDHGAIDAAGDDLFDALATESAIRLVTLAPERTGALARIERLVARGVAVALGHTDATYEQAIAAADAGATMVTHLYNAMSPLSHREPGVVGAALDDARLVAGLIADGVHAHPAALRLALRAKGASRVALVTDAMAGAGAGDGDLTLAGRRVRVRGMEARLDDGTLAGSVLTLDQAVRNAVALAGATAAEALQMASTVPATILGLPDRGRFTPGARADLVAWDDTLHVQATWIAGRRTHFP